MSNPSTDVGGEGLDRSAAGWADRPAGVLCPLCDYDLRGLQTPRCPECGYRFTWEELLDPQRARHPYLFEHHPQRNVWSYWRTLVGGLRPGRFWTSIFPTQPSRPGRLLAYAVVTCVLTLLVPAGAMVLEGVRMAEQAAQMRSLLAARRLSGVTPAQINQWYPRPGSAAFFATMLHRQNVRVLAGMSLAAVWPVAMFVALSVFQISMRRARIRQVHVARCVVYSCDGTVWVAVAAIGVGAAVAAAAGLADAVSLPPLWREVLSADVAMGVVTLVELAMLGVLIPYRLVQAYRKYLRFDHPVATVVAAQIMVMLLAFIALINLSLR